MFSRSVFFIILFYINSSLFAQQDQEISGYWAYETVLHEVEKDSTKVKLVENLYGDLYIHFNKNGKYSSQILNRNEKGEWNYNQKEDKIELRSSKGAIVEIKVIDVNAQILIIQLANEIFKLKKHHNYLLSVPVENTTFEKKKSKKRKKKKRKNRIIKM